MIQKLKQDKWLIDVDNFKMILYNNNKKLKKLKKI